MSGVFPMAKRALAAEDGALTSLGLFLLITMFAVGGLALDVANAVRVRTELQVAADAAAHAALYTRDSGTAAEAQAAAWAIGRGFLPPARHGNAYDEGDVEFGLWDRETRSFTPDADSKTAVRVTTRRQQSRANAVGTYLLKFVGFDSWDLARIAVFETYTPSCFREGFVADGIVDLRSNNSYYNGFCIHSNTHVELQQNNYFQDGTIVSMPDKGAIVLPASGLKKNDGLETALADAEYQLRIINRLQGLISGLSESGSEQMPDYIDNAAVVILDTKKTDASHFISGRRHVATCSGKGKLTIPGTLLTDMVIVTNCNVEFAQGAVLENVVVATTSTDDKSVKASSGLQIGRNDDCATDGGAQILTLGGVNVAAGLALYGGQIIADKSIEFSANADGIKGASLIAGDTISGTSNMTMGFCGNGMERNFSSRYFRLAD